MELSDIASQWLATPGGQQWARGRIRSELAKFPTLANYPENEVIDALSKATSPASLAASILRSERVVFGRVTFEDVAIQSDANHEPWQSAKFSLEHGANLLRMPKAEFDTLWMNIHLKNAPPAEVTGFDVLLVAILEWLQSVRTTRPKEIIRLLLLNRPEGRNWVLTASGGKVTVYGAPIVIRPTSRTIPKIFDPIELINCIDEAAEALRP